MTLEEIHWPADSEAFVHRSAFLVPVVPSSSCHAERSEAPAERSRRPALSIVEGTPLLRATPKAHTNFLGRRCDTTGG
jgi:hypothetical protein